MRLIDKNGKGTIVALIMYSLFVLYLFFHHMHVGMYFDDFGNASLSYGYNSPNVYGTSYSFSQLLDWCYHNYLGWGGRFLATMILAPHLKTGAMPFMMVQVILLILIFITSSFLMNLFSHGDRILLMPFPLMLIYGLLKGYIVSDGIYWASASVQYVWTMFPVYVLLYNVFKLREELIHGVKISKYNVVGIFLSAPFATLIQEQISGMILVCLAWLLVTDCLFCRKKIICFRKLSLIYGILFLILLAMSLVVFLAPGNFVRMAASPDFASKSLYERVIYNFPNVIALMNDYSLSGCNVIIQMSVPMMGLLLINRNGTAFRKVIFVIGAFLAVFNIICNFDFFQFESLTKESCFVFQMIVLFICALLYFGETDRIAFLAIPIGAVASVLCMVFSPALSQRTLLPYIFMMGVFISVIWADFFHDLKFETNGIKLIIVSIQLLLILITSKNMYNIYSLYYENYPVYKMNYSRLSNYKETERDGIIELTKYPNDEGRSFASYDEGYEYIDYWYKEYFNIPNYIDIKWK